MFQRQQYHCAISRALTSVTLLSKYQLASSLPASSTTRLNTNRAVTSSSGRDSVLRFKLTSVSPTNRNPTRPRSDTLPITSLGTQLAILLYPFALTVMQQGRIFFAARQPARVHQLPQMRQGVRLTVDDMYQGLVQPQLVLPMNTLDQLVKMPLCRLRRDLMALIHSTARDQIQTKRSQGFPDEPSISKEACNS